MADGSKIVSHGMVRVKPLPSLHLQFVLYMPSSPFNLISISQVTHTPNCTITYSIDSYLRAGYGEDNCYGAWITGLYYIQLASLVIWVATDSS